ncbi:hypothetical protein [Actinomadura flavalba]|uniref:hypothetical protein n=1 Tax=Actinomadura flavalba TaxID=1120938 RepID=UPI000366DB7B|nr:hypothetical protein [Actinomadura flavalba]
MTTHKPTRLDGRAGLGDPQGDAQTSPAQLHDDAGQTLDTLGADRTKARKAAWSGGAGLASIAAGVVAVLLWRRHVRRSQTNWARAQLQLQNVAGNARDAAGPARDKAVAGAVKAKEKAAHTGGKAVQAAKDKAKR